ncbi:MAG: hypothetical protein AB8B64_02820 [Granulosicoccus sp.]
MITVESCKPGIPEASNLPRPPCPERSIKLWLPLMYVASALLLSACQTIRLTHDTNAAIPQAASVSAVDRAIAADVIRTARQIYNPFNTTLQVSRNDNDPLLAHFIEEFARAGYGIQRVSADQGSNFLSLSSIRETNDDGELLIRFNSSIGAVDIGRDYRSPSANTITPASPFRLSGTRAAVDVPDEPDASFRVTDASHSRAVYEASLNLNEQVPPIISLITNEIVDNIASQSVQSASLQALNSSRIEVNNLFYSDQSNFSSILDNYEQIERQIVVFGNDSMILGNTNKSLIEQFVQERFGPDDLISLVGCSNGPTALDIGNEGLALGRAERVTQALLSQGIARDRILDEGCWAPVSARNRFPSRGVVLELWRKIS